MNEISVTKDVAKLTLTNVSEFDAGIDRLWQVYADPAQLAQWWGPPQWPATFARHEFRAGGESRYHMTGPDGEKSYGWWQILEVDPPRSFTYLDGFAGDDGEPSGELGTTTTTVTLTDLGERTRLTSVTRFESVEQLEEMVRMGMEEGLRAAVGQIDSVLARG